MLREQFEHVVEKGNAGFDGIASIAIEIQRQFDIRFVRLAFNVCFACVHGVSCVEGCG